MVGSEDVRIEIKKMTTSDRPLAKDLPFKIIPIFPHLHYIGANRGASI